MDDKDRQPKFQSMMDDSIDEALVIAHGRRQILASEEGIKSR